jgi:CheY-like chemotaxis protein
VTRILVVDDDPTVREVVLSYLTAEHYEVAEAADGETALAIIGSDGTVALLDRARARLAG